MFLPLEWIGMNAMLVYVMAAADIFPAFINGWYYDDPHNTLVWFMSFALLYLYLLYFLLICPRSCKELGSRASENNVISFLNLNIWVSGYVLKIWVVMDRRYVCPKRVFNRRYFVLHFRFYWLNYLQLYLKSTWI